MTQDARTSDTAAEGSSSSEARHTGRWHVKSWLAIFVFVCLALAAQQRDLLNDRSISNITTFACLAFAALILGRMVFLWTAAKTSNTLAIVLALVIIAIPISLLRFRGFYGAMIPMFEFRFKPRATLQENPVGLVSETPEVQSSPEPFLQFLGNDRNGIVSERDFSLPPSQGVEELWRIPVGEGWSGFAIKDQYCVTLEQRDDAECVACYRFGDGKMIWLHEVTARHDNPMGGLGPRSVPAIDGEYVYTLGATGILQCFKIATGEVVWRKELLTLGGWDQDDSESALPWGRSASPLVTDGLCIVPFGRPLDSEPTAANLSGRSLVAFDAVTGEVRWSEGEDQISYASSVVLSFAGIRQIVSVNERTVTGHRIDDGKVIWTLSWPGQSNGAPNCSSALAIEGQQDAFLIAKGYGVGSGVFKVIQGSDDQWEVQELWTSHRVLKTKFTHACVDGNVAYALSDGSLECVDLADGTRLWMQSRSSRYGHGQMLRVDDCLVIQAEDGTVAFVEASPDEYKVLGEIDSLAGKTWNMPSIAGRYLAVRNDGEAVMYRLPARNTQSDTNTQSDIATTTRND